MAFIAHRIDYEDRRSVLRQASLHDILDEDQKPAVSRLIFVSDKNPHGQDHQAKDHHADCVRCQNHLMHHWGWSDYLFRTACCESNGYVLDAGTDGEKAIKHLRCLVKDIELKEKNGKLEIVYEWYEMTITMRQHRNGSVSIICFGVPNTFHASFEAALVKVASDRQWKNDGQRVAAALMEEIVRLYDRSIWKISNTIRKVEKDRYRAQFDFWLMHELLRHAIHTTEVLEVAVDSLTELNRIRLTGTAPPDPATVSNAQVHVHYDFWCRLLQNFTRRSKANESRLQNEIHLALNLVTQKDSRATVALSKSAQKDSAAMRTIAFVTLIFLPATFVATIFGMSFFQGSTGRWTETGQFWVFWAVSIPLTVLTIVGWFVMQMRLKKRHVEKWGGLSMPWDNAEGDKTGLGDVESGVDTRKPLDLGRVKTAGGDEVDRMATGFSDGARKGVWGSWRRQT